MDPVVVDALQRGQWSSGDFLCSFYHSLQACVDHSHIVLPYQMVIWGQDGLNSAAVEVAEDLWRHAKLPQPPQKIQPLLGQ